MRSSHDERIEMELSLSVFQDKVNRKLAEEDIPPVEIGCQLKVMEITCIWPGDDFYFWPGDRWMRKGHNKIESTLPACWSISSRTSRFTKAPFFNMSGWRVTYINKVGEKSYGWYDFSGDPNCDGTFWLANKLRLEAHEQLVLDDQLVTQIAGLVTNLHYNGQGQADYVSIVSES